MCWFWPGEIGGWWGSQNIPPTNTTQTFNSISMPLKTIETGGKSLSQTILLPPLLIAVGKSPNVSAKQRVLGNKSFCEHAE